MSAPRAALTMNRTIASVRFTAKRRQRTNRAALASVCPRRHGALLRAILVRTAAMASPANSSNPILVETTRGDMVESRHAGAAAVVDAAGRVVRSWGDIHAPVFARSAIKPLQALPLVETGAAERFGLRDAEIALACASHRGEPIHVETVRRWLARADLGPQDLECGSHAPGNAAAAEALIRAGEAPSAVHNNCSGKHSGFLT